jgi:hypothetical protein
MNIHQSISTLSVGKPQVHRGLALFPLIGKKPGKRDYLTLNEAFDRKGIEIREVSEHGSVPELKLRNLLERDVFAADGETLLGAKQNRVLNVSIYVPAKAEITIPVSCVEQGRWGYRQRDFSPSEYSEFLSSRAAKMASVEASLKSDGSSRRSDQRAVWDEMENRRRTFAARAPTSSMSDIYRARRRSLDEYLKQFRPQRRQLGMACAIDGRTVSIEVFEDPGVFHQYFDRMVRAYAAEVLADERIATVVPDARALEELLQRIATSRWADYPAVGSGRELRTRIGKLHGSALDVDGRLLHMAVLGNPSRRPH